MIVFFSLTIPLYVSLALYVLLLSSLSHCRSSLMPDVCLWPVVCSVRITVKQRRSFCRGMRISFNMLSKTAERHIAANLVPLLMSPPPTCKWTYTLSARHAESPAFQSELCVSDFSGNLRPVVSELRRGLARPLWVCIVCSCGWETSGSMAALGRAMLSSPWSLTSGDQPGM